jgi:hypothetical protein
MAKIQNQIELIEIPPNVDGIVSRRMEPFVNAALRKAGIVGQIDLNNLALSAYLQGFCDAGEAYDHQQQWIGVA